MNIIKLLVVSSSIFLSGCAVKLVSDYDETTDRSISDINSRISAYLYDPETPQVGINKKGTVFYEKLRQKIRDLRFRAKSIPKNDITLKQLDILEQQVDLFAQRDEQGYRPEESILFINYFDQTCGAILKFEIAKKRQ